MRIISKTIQVIYNLYAITIFLVLMIFMLPLVLLTYFFSADTRGNYIYKMAQIAIDIAMFLCGMHHTNIFETPHDLTKPSIFVFNHISYLDALIILKAVRKQHYRGLGKAEIGNVPILGFIYRSAVIMVKRTDAADRARSVADLKTAIQNNISIILAPEGTFNYSTKPLTHFYDGAFRIAIETQTPIKPLLFLDTYDRLHYGSLFSLTPGKSRVVYLEEIAVEGYQPEDLPLLKEKVYKSMESALIRYKAAWIKE